MVFLVYRGNHKRNHFYEKDKEWYAAISYQRQTALLIRERESSSKSLQMYKCISDCSMSMQDFI